IDPLNPNLAYAAIDKEGIYTSSDEGNTWSANPIANFGSGNQGRQTIAIGPNTGKCANFVPNCGAVYLMIGGVDGNTFETVGFSGDGGTTWSTKTVPSVVVGTSPNQATLDGSSIFDFNQSFYDQAMVVSPANASEAFFGGVGLYQSNDGGSN